MKRSTPPGPRNAFFGYGHVRPLMEDALGYILSLHNQYGPAVQFRIGPIRIYGFMQPDHVYEILVTKAEAFHKPRFFKRTFRPWIGQGILLNDGPSFPARRRAVNAALQQHDPGQFVSVVARHTQQLAAAGRDREIDMAEALERVAFASVLETVLGPESAAHGDELFDAATFIANDGIRRNSTFAMPGRWLPTRANRRFREALRLIHRRVDDAILACRRDEPSCVLTRLLKALPAGDAVLSEDAVREEARTLIFGGKETAGASLTWSAYALAAHGEIQAKAADEVDRVLGDAPVTAAAIGRLKYIEQVYKEAIRIYPPVAFMSREAAQDAEVGGYFVPRRSFVFISPYVMHHNPEWFAEPDVFRPERFQPASEKAIPQLAYVPFGAGAHNCVGKRLAMLEGPTALATLLQHCRLELPDPPPKVELVADMTLHPKGGLRLRLAPRKKALAVVE